MTRKSPRELASALEDLTDDTGDGRPDLSDGWDFIDTDDETPDREPDHVEDGFKIYTRDEGDL